MIKAMTACDKVSDCRNCYYHLTFSCSVLNKHSCGKRGQFQMTRLPGEEVIWYVGCTKEDCQSGDSYGPFSSKLEAMTFWNKKFNYVTRGETHESK